MLNELHIENIAVIERADIRFDAGMNVLTGETGAGKSIVIDAIGAVLGERVSRELVRRGADKALVTACFDLGGCEDWLRDNEIEAEDELILQRRITADGKSGCRVCGVPVSAAQMKELAARLVDVHGQNDGRLLLDERLHIDYLDRFGAYTEQIAAFDAAYARYRELKTEISRLSMDELEKARLSDSLKAQIDELERAELKPGEQEEISGRSALLRNAEKLTEALDAAYASLNEGDDNALSFTQNAAYYAQRAAAITPELAPAEQALREAIFSLSDAAEQLRDFREGLDFSPEEYDRLESRLALFRRLERKYARPIDELPDYLADCRRRLDEMEYADERLEKLEKQLAEQQARCREAAGRLSLSRRQAARELEKRIVAELRALNMPGVRFQVAFTPVNNALGFERRGAEQIAFLMSANAGEEPGRISRIASGGELSRIMLAMKNVFAAHDPVETMIFDEIDTGVSGVAAQRVGEKLYAVSRGKQVLCVTHLPQIAAMADSHFVIVKQERAGRTYTEVSPLDREGRRRELARLHGGEHITATTLLSAEEQLCAAEKYKEKATRP